MSNFGVAKPPSPSIVALMSTAKKINIWPGEEIRNSKVIRSISE